MRRIVSILLIAVMVLGFNQQAFAGYYNGAYIDKSVNTTINNGLINLLVYHPQKRTIIQTKSPEQHKFSNTVQEYDIYLLGSDAKEFTIQPKIRSKSDMVKINGQQYFNNEYASIKVDDIRDNKILIETFDRNSQKPYIYTINVNIEDDTSLEPRVKLSLGGSANNEYTELTVSLENTRTNAFSINIYNNDADTVFTNLKNEPFENSDKDLSTGGNGLNYYELSKDVSVSQMKFDDGKLIVSLNTRDAKGISTYGESVDILKLRIKSSTMSTNKQVRDQLRIVTNMGKNALYDLDKYGDINHRVFEEYTTDEIKYGSKDKTLVYISAVEQNRVQMYVNHLTSNDFVKYTIENVDTQDVAVKDGELIDGAIDANLHDGNYKLSIYSDGYLTYDGNFNIAGIDVYLRSLKLLAGDIQGDKTIDTQDRDMLLKVYNTVATDGKSGGTAADFNNDNWVNALDLGQLLSNIGAKYKR